MALNNFKSVQKTLGLLLMVFSFSMLVPFIVSALFNDTYTASSFLASFTFTLFFGLAVWLPSREVNSEIRLKEGFMIVASFWIILALFGAIPFLMLPESTLSITDAIFESTSGLTTTGATIMTNIDSLPKGLLFYRAQLQWLGGLGIIVLAVAILPLLGVGGMHLYKAEAASSVREPKFTPRQKQTARSLAYIYIILTAFCALGYLLGGMNLFDAVCHAMTTVAIGGFSTHDASFGFFEGSTLIFWVSSVFMLLAGINFSLHFFAWKHKSLSTYINDSEFKAYLSLLLLVIVIAGLALITSSSKNLETVSFSELFFQVVSIGTTTGYTTAEYGLWPIFIPFLLLVISFVGGCVGSTGGGLKVARVLILFKQGLREAKRLVHPSAEIVVKINSKGVDQKILDSVWGFMSAYIGILVVFTLTMMACGLNELTAFSAVAASLNNLGPGLGDVFVNYNALGLLPKWVCISAMVLGRLEIFALLVLFTPTFWQD
jgi:trk system potassium uptake protein TrkH